MTVERKREIASMKLNEEEKLAVRRFRSMLENMLGGRVVEVKLFGSRARGNSHRDSDLDMLVVVSTGDWHISDVVYGIATDVLLETGVCISPKVINRKQYRHLSKIGAPFLRNVIREGIAV
jgi:predicted nucleotidyltransferase